MTVKQGGQLCCFAAPPSDANDTSSCPVYNGSSPLPTDLLYDIEADPAERHDLAPSQPALVASMLQRLAKHNATNEPCCICTGSDRTSEMDQPPPDGYWYSFADQTPNPAPDCKLQRDAEMVSLVDS